MWLVLERVFYSFLFFFKYFLNKSGLFFFVLSIAFSSLHFSISGKLPLNNTSGTFQPLNYLGLVYIGAASKLSWKESVRADVSSPNTPGSNLIIESHKTAAANSPPVKT
mgnify:CR=1 FL=1